MQLPFVLAAADAIAVLCPSQLHISLQAVPTPGITSPADLSDLTELVRHHGIRLPHMIGQIWGITLQVGEHEGPACGFPVISGLHMEGRLQQEVVASAVTCNTLCSHSRILHAFVGNAHLSQWQLHSKKDHIYAPSPLPLVTCPLTMLANAS